MQMPTEIGLVMDEERSGDEQQLIECLLVLGGDRVVLMQDEPEFVQKLTARRIMLLG
jgi:hypothetical protein